MSAYLQNQLTNSREQKNYYIKSKKVDKIAVFTKKVL